MKSNTKIKLEDALENKESYIEQMKAMDDNKLSKNLDLFRAQMEKAYNDKNETAFELLNEYENQVIIARANKD